MKELEPARYLPRRGGTLLSVSMRWMLHCAQVAGVTMSSLVARAPKEDATWPECRHPCSCYTVSDRPAGGMNADGEREKGKGRTVSH